MKNGLKRVPFLLVGVALIGAVASFSTYAEGATIQIWLTHQDLSRTLQPQGEGVFAAGSNAGQTTIYIDETIAYQTFDGIGASLTDSAAWLISTKLSESGRAALMSKLFDPNAGIGLSWLRQPMGASDFTVNGNYSYDDMPPGQTDDASLSHFSIAHDEAYILPLIKQAISLNPSLKVMITPWSPPAWMKSNGSMNGGTLNPSAYDPLALYFVKTIKTYTAAGIPIYALTVQNEPLHQTESYPSMSLPVADAGNFIRDQLGPTLAREGLGVKILGYDHNWDRPDYVQSLYADASAAAYLSGSAWHFYAGDVFTMNDIHHQYPDRDIFFTEGSSGTWRSNPFDAAITDEIAIFRNWSKTFTVWNIALDSDHGPTNGGCKTCTGLVTIDQADGSVRYGPTYYAMGHISKFVVPGAKRTASTGYTQGLHNVAFKNPDGSKALIVYNQNGANSQFAIQWGNASFSYTLPATSIATFKWSGMQVNSTVIPAGVRLIASAFHEARGIRLESTTDTGGGQNVSYASAGSHLLFKNVDLTNMTSVSARLANGGANASLELRVDSPTGPLLGTVPANGTGGWQSWVTNSAAISAGSGVHDVYVVFRGPANLNWVQFSSGGDSNV